MIAIYELIRETRRKKGLIYTAEYLDRISHCK
jgi:hypothetical protein